MADHEPTPAQAQEGNHRKKGLLPTLDSYQSRYLLYATLIVSLLLATAWLGHRYVRNVTDEQVKRMELRAALEQRLRKSTGALRAIERWMERQLIEPGVRQPVSLETLLERFREALPRPGRFPAGSRERRELRRLEEELLPAMAGAGREFVAISRDNSRRFPATRIMQEQMRNRAEAFTDRVNQAIDELGTPSSPRETELLLALYRLRDTWQKIIGEFRLLVANRFGVFADSPLAGVEARASNIDLYFRELLRQLDQLQSRPGEEEILLAGNETWQELRRTAGEWHTHYQAVLAELSRKAWRKDLDLYWSVLQPSITGMHEILDGIQQALYREATAGIHGLSATAENLGKGLFLFTALLVAVILAGYFHLRTRILRPISETTRALRHEALGLAPAPMELPKLRETRELVSAFAEMKREVQRRQRGLDHLAHHDALTQLPNRVLFKDRLQHAINLALRNNQVVALLFLDLDNFKQINDTLGHLAGDELLIHVAHRLKSLLRHTDTVARFGGDEFAILLENVAGKRQTRNIASKILNALSEPIPLGDQEYHLTVSIGIAMAPHDDRLPDNLIRDADTAMYEAKRRGKNAYSFFSSELLQRATSQLNLERDIRTALEEKEFLFHFQPIIHTRSRKIYGVEALIRWSDRSGHLRHPGEFMDTLLALDPRQEFMEELMERVDRLQDRCLEELQIPLRVSVNMSASVLRNASRHKLVLNSLKRRAHPELLHVEITEDTLLEDLTNARVLLNEIKRLGIPLVLDDFGTGQSSLNHLRSFPFDAIKIDREFIMNLHRNPDDATLVKAITQLAHSFNMKVVAEGVENREQHRFLTEIGCDYVQGYLISRPLPEERLFALLQHMRTRPKALHQRQEVG